MPEEWRVTIALPEEGAAETLRALFPDYRLSGDGTSRMAYADSKERAEEVAAALQGAVPSEITLDWWDGQKWRPVDEHGISM